VLRGRVTGPTHKKWTLSKVRFILLKRRPHMAKKRVKVSQKSLEVELLYFNGRDLKAAFLL